MKTLPPFSLARRKFLIAGVASACTLGAVGVFSRSEFTSYRARWIQQVVRRNLPGVVLDEPSLAVFVNDMLAGSLLRPFTRKAAVFIEQVTPWLTARIPEVRVSLLKLERQVLTEYLLGSDFFRVSDPKRVTITYFGLAVACANPFVSPNVHPT